MKLNLLFVSNSSPFPPRDGKRQRTLALLLAALQVYEVDYLILGNQSEYEISSTHSISGLRFYFLPQAKQSRSMKGLGLSFIPNMENQNRIREFLRGRIYSIILCRYALAAKDLPNISHLLIDVDDDYAELMRSKISNEISTLKKLRYWQIFQMNLPFYSKVLKKASHLIWVKPQNKQLKGSILPNLPFQLLMQKDTHLKAAKTNSIMFLGKLSYAPNSKGIRWFLENVWTSLYLSIANISLTIISTVSPDSELEELIRSSKGVNLDINVGSLVNAYQQHALCIVPIFFGGGSNVKLAEALFMGREVVSSQFGAKGFEEWVESDLVHIAKTPEEWNLEICNLLVKPWSEEDFCAVRREFSLKAWNAKVLKVLNES